MEGRFAGLAERVSARLTTRMFNRRAEAMSHLDPEGARRPTRELRKFGLLVGGAFLALATISYVRHKPAGVFGTMGVVGALLFVVGGVAPRALGGVYAGWMRFALALNKITTPILMGAIYFIVLTPLSLAMRAFGWRPFGAVDATTAWVTRAPDARVSSLERQF